MTTASISETRQQLSSFLDRVKRNQEDVIIQNRGEAEAVIISMPDYALLQEAREKRRRQQAIAELKQLAAEIGHKNEDMSVAEVAEAADEISREAVRNLVSQGKVTFEA